MSVRETTCPWRWARYSSSAYSRASSSIVCAAAPGDLLCRVDLQVADAIDRRRLPVPAPHHRPHAGQQLLPGERLDQVVVGPQVQALHPVLHAVPRGQAEHRRAARSRRRSVWRIANPSFARQHHVQQHRVVRVRLRQVQRLVPVVRQVDGVPLVAQPVGQRAGQRRMIFGDQDPHRPFNSPFGLAAPIVGDRGRG